MVNSVSVLIHVCVQVLRVLHLDLASISWQQKNSEEGKKIEKE